MTLLALTEHIYFSSFYIGDMQEIHSLLSSLSSPSLIHHPHTWGYTIKLLLPAAHEPLRRCLCWGRKCFPISSICHCLFPSSAECLAQLVNWFIMLSPPEEVRGRGVRRKHKPGGGWWGWRTVLGVMRRPRWKPSLSGANLIGANFLLGFLDFKRGEV